MKTGRRAMLLLAGSLLAGSAPAQAQAPAWGPELLPLLRRAADLVPGERPRSLHMVTPLSGRGPLGDMVEGAAPSDTVLVGDPVYQLRFRRGWIAVDPGVDSQFAHPGSRFSRTDCEVVQRMLRGARLVLLTHEHPDHVAALFRSPYLAEIQAHTIVTRQQVESLQQHPLDPKLALDSAAAARYLVIDYRGWIPIAPGVVLLEAPGHSPGTQMIFVRLASGAELLISGDVAWHTAGITRQRQKPEGASKGIAEDRAAVAPQLAWLKAISDAGVTVLVHHDQGSIEELVRRGVVKQGFDVGE